MKKGLIIGFAAAVTEYKNEVGNFASTGGWTLGNVDGGGGCGV